MGSEDLEGDSSKSEAQANEEENPKGDLGEGRMEFIMQAHQTRGPEGLGD